MNSRLIVLIFSVVVLSSCGTSRKTLSGKHALPATKDELLSYCDTVSAFHSLYMNKIKAEIWLDGERYDAKIAIYYVPDSVVYVSAMNAGFEIIRAGITADSTLIINRIDKTVIVYDPSGLGAAPPVDFNDLQYLLNRPGLCGFDGKRTINDSLFIFDRSTFNIKKVIKLGTEGLVLKGFEYFQKKSGKYIVAERMPDNALEILSNFIFDDVKIIAESGEIEYNKAYSVKLNYNRAKYTVIRFR